MNTRLVYDGTYYIVYNSDYELAYSVYVYKKGVYIVENAYYVNTLSELKEKLLIIDPLNADLIIAREEIKRKMEGTL